MMFALLELTAVWGMAVPFTSGQETAKLLWSRIRRRKSGGCVMKECVLTLHGHPKESKIDGVKFRRVCCLTSGFFMQGVTPANHDGIRGRGSNLGTVLKVQGKRRNVLATV
jgi:hypothetical protein